MFMHAGQFHIFLFSAIYRMQMLEPAIFYHATNSYVVYGMPNLSKTLTNAIDYLRHDHLAH